MIILQQTDKIFSLLETYNPKWLAQGSNFADNFINGWNGRELSMRASVETQMKNVGVLAIASLIEGFKNMETNLDSELEKIFLKFNKIFGNKDLTESETNVTAPKSNSVNVQRFQVGMDYVPYDMFPAFLDEGERVLTKAENEEYNSEEEKTIVINQYFYGVKEEKTAFELKRAAERLAREVLN